MSEELKKTDIKKIAGRGCLVVAGILFLLFLCRYNQIKKESLYDTEGRTFAKAEVTDILQDNETKDGIYIGRQLVKLPISFFLFLCSLWEYPLIFLCGNIILQIGRAHV